MRPRLAIGFLAVFGACGEDQEPTRLPVCEVGQSVVDSSIDGRAWVIDSVQLPTSNEASKRYALNIDCDVQERVDNGLGGLLTVISSYESSDLNWTLEQMISGGRLLHLLNVRPVLHDHELLAVTLLHGLDADDDLANNLTGNGSFAVDPDRGRGTMLGSVVDGELSALGRHLPLGLTMPGLEEVVILPVEAGRVQATFAEGRITGIIAGAMTETTVETVLAPFIHLGLVRAIERDCTDIASGMHPCGCEPDSFGAKLIEYYDVLPDDPLTVLDGDCMLTLDELLDSPLTSLWASPDVDLFDADGALNPRTDGVKDSMSLGIGFTAVPARLEN